jgi:succinate dehydrogenase / fumarate reductase cytochrome b subunit
MTHFTPIKVVSYLLYASIVVQAVYAFIISAGNKKARPIAYAVQAGSQNSPWTSRNMGILGTILLVFIVVHMSDFWFEYKFGHVPYANYYTNVETGETKFVPAPPDYKQFNKIEESVISSAEGQFKVTTVKDLYAEVAEGFKEWWLVLVYIVSMAAVSFHLYHGFQSAFQTFGWNHKKYTPLIKLLGVGYSIIICLLFAMMPIAIYLHWVG